MAQYEPFDLVRMFLGEDWHVRFWAEVACRTAVMYLLCPRRNGRANCRAVRNIVRLPASLFKRSARTPTYG